MRLPTASVLAVLLALAGVLAGCLGSGGGGSGCEGSATTFRSSLRGFHEAVLARPTGLPASSVQPPQGMAMEDALPWADAQAHRLVWSPEGMGAGTNITLSGRDRDLRVAAALPGSLDQEALAERVVSFLAQATDLEPEARVRVADGIEWRSSQGKWRGETGLRATVRLPGPLSGLRALPDASPEAAAGARQYEQGGFAIHVLVPTQRYAVAAGGVTADVAADEDDRVEVRVTSRGHTEADAARFREAALALTGWSGEAAWQARHEARATLPAAAC
ncbi:MAG TPA: hypothetical protein VFH47_02945 [Candidatus Thermoplasmatota archaeon]|nr:hypothetical protein [Candidatus Thermoplasmatota archaeon]